ncbi:MAG: mechanosensitive ion channel family protein [Nostocaceae cyanobacterium]|nr:mechanosensitive ion channel family protein [Nostocaceae cyanobacterium]
MSKIYGFIYKLIALGMVIFVLIIASPLAYSQINAQVQVIEKKPAAVTKIDGTPVILGAQKLFVIQAGVGSFTAAERAQTVAHRVETIANDSTIKVESFKIVDEANITNILAGEKLLFTITDKDGKAADTTRQELAREYLQKFEDVISKYRKERSAKSIILGIVYTFISTIVLLISLKFLNQIFRRSSIWINHWRETHIPAITIQNIEVLSASRFTALLHRSINFLHLVAVLGILYIYLPLVLSLFPWTKPLSTNLYHYFIWALHRSLQGFLKYFPNIFALGLIIFFTYYIIKFIRPIFKQLGSGSISIPGFYPEWAEPTYKLVLFLIIALALVAALPYLPGFGTPAFQGISVFLGVLFSLGSTAIVANIVAGTILIYTRAFHIGDRIQIGDAIGDIVEKTLLVTRIRTIKNVVITIPNATVINSQIVNFSTLSQDPNHYLILHTTVTLGYDVPWRKVHQVLIDAALATEHILAQPAPFVLQTSLDDFYVSYQLNAYTNKPTIMSKIYSQLHQNIQDKCNQADIEILSPHYAAMRDGNQITIPENYLSKDYKAPGFRLSPLENLFNPPNGK